MALENDAAQVEADKCAVIAKDVSELAARCEADLAAAEPLVAQAEAALDTLNKKDLGELPLSCFEHPITACLAECSRSYHCLDASSFKGTLLGKHNVLQKSGCQLCSWVQFFGGKLALGALNICLICSGTQATSVNSE